MVFRRFISENVPEVSIQYEMRAVWSRYQILGGKMHRECVPAAGDRGSCMWREGGADLRLGRLTEAPLRLIRRRANIMPTVKGPLS
jgi:hypothetical protein